GKDGREIWIQAAYNPIVDADGKIYKVVKFATDVTQRMSAMSLLGGALRQLSDGDLTRTLDTPFVPSMEQVRQDFNTAIKDLAETMKTIGENASAIAAGSREIGAS
ncbi:chemotaxis protein, partial [Rhizobium ruizarguesonis]